MTAARPSIANLHPNPAWVSLPLFDRAVWNRVRFWDVVGNCAETCDPEEAELGECGGWDAGELPTTGAGALGWRLPV